MAPRQLLDQCEVKRTRRSGPGGQHRNKVETAIVLHHRPTGVTAEAAERRSQAENRAVAVFRLRLNLALQVRLPSGGDHAPSPLWQSRCSGQRIHVSDSHADFPTLLAEALDAIAAGKADVKAAAASLGCSASQLLKFVKKDARALALVNTWRCEHELHPLR